MTDLSTTYLGLRLKSPLVVSASPLSEDIDNIRRMEDAGAAAVVMHSLFEEQITLASHELDCHLSHGAESFAEACSTLLSGCFAGRCEPAPTRTSSATNTRRTARARMRSRPAGRRS